MVISRRPSPEADDDHPVSTHIGWESGQVSALQRASLLGQYPMTIWLTGLPASGKSSIAKVLERRLVDAGRPCFVLDGDNLRHGLNRDLGFSPQDRKENIRRVAEVARLMNDAGLIVITAFISPYRDDREAARRVVGAERFLEVYLSAPLATCEARDPKGLYRRARSGEITDFTAVSAPYEVPASPELVLDTANADVGNCVERLWRAIAERQGTRLGA